MGMSRSEIEILVKARNEAQGAFDSLSKQVSAVTGGARAASDGLEQVGKKTEQAGAASTGASVMFGMLAERLARGLVGAIGDTISAANRLDSSLIGLSSVAKAFGQSADDATGAARVLAADGLMSVGDAATGLKNLLAAGFGLDQAVVLMNRFKDSAAFGRQGALSFGEAIRGATEGIKNGNCLTADTPILVAGGRQVPIGDLFRAGVPVDVYSLRPDGSLRHTPVSHVVHNGRRPVFALTLESGKSVRATGNHRFLTPNGWRFLQDLSVGDEVLTVNAVSGYHAPCPGRSPVASADAPSPLPGGGDLRRLASAAVRVKAHGEVPTFAGRWRRIGAAETEPPLMSVHARSAEATSSLNPASGRPASLGSVHRPVGPWVGRRWWGRCLADGWRGFRACANGAGRWLSEFLASRKPSGFAVGHVETVGRVPFGWPVRIIQTGAADTDPSGRRFAQLGHIDGGGLTSSGGTEIGVISAIDSWLAQIVKPIMSSALPTIPVWPLTSKTDEQPVEIATSVFTLDRDRVRSVHPGGHEDVYDLSVPETHNFIAAGIVSHNSILVDNAGVTKNLSQMLTEAGFSAQDLSKASSDVNVRMAIYNGILKETNPQLGDAARFLETAAGKQAAFSAQVEIAQQKLGQALQPALLKTLAALTPMIVAFGDLAPVIVPVGTAMAAIVIPMAAMRAAAALGIPSVSALTASMVKLWVTAAGSPAFATAAATVSAGSLVIGRSSLILDQYGRAAETVGVQAATATPKISLMTKVLGAFVAFEIGQAVGNLIVKIQDAGKASESTGGKIAAAFMKYTGIGAMATAIQGVTEAVATAADGTASFGDQMRAIEKASEQAGRQILSYHEAMVILAGSSNQAEDAMKRFWATFKAKEIIPPTLQQGQALLDQFMRIAGAADKSKERINGWNAELNRVANAGGMPTLRKELELGVRSTKELSEEFGLSEAAIKFYEKKLKDASDAAKAHEQRQKELTQAQKDAESRAQKLGDELGKLGVITADTGKRQLTALLDPLSLLATVKGPALERALIALYPELQNLARLAAASGVSVDGLGAALDRAKAAADAQIGPMAAWEASLPQAALADIIGSTHAWTAEQEIAATQAGITKDAFVFFGLSTRDELQKTAAEAERHYRTIVAAVGANAPEAVAAYQNMIDAQKTATQQVPSLWQSEIFPKVKGVIGTLTDAINGSFAQMLLGAKGFKDGFVDIWNSIKSAIGNILNSLLSTFLNSFLKGILGAMTGQQGAFSAAFAGLFGGGGSGGLGALMGLGGGGTGGVGGLLGGLFGGGGVAGAGGAVIGPELGVGGGVLATGGGGLGGLAVTAAGGLGAAAAGFGLGKMFQSFLGGAGWGAATGGGLSGAGAGAAIGSIVPGIGTAVGAILGGLAGIIGGAFGQSQGMKTNDKRDEFFAQFGGAGTGAGSGFGNVAAELAKLSEAAGGGFGGGTLFQNLIKADTLKELESAVRAVQAAMEGAEYATVKVGEATDALTEQRHDLIRAGRTEDDVLKAQAADYSALLATIRTTGATAPDALKPILERLIDMGALVDANGAAVVDLGGVQFASMAADGSAHVQRLTADLTAMERSEQDARSGADGIRAQIASLQAESRGHLENLRLDLAAVTAEGDRAATSADDIRRQIAVLGPEGGARLNDLQADLAGFTAEAANARDKAQDLQTQIETATANNGGQIRDLEATLAAFTTQEEQAALKADGLRNALTAATTDTVTGLGSVDEAIVRSGRKWDEYAERGGFVGDAIITGLAGVGTFAEEIASNVGAAFGNLHIEVPVRWNLDELPDGGPPPAAAGGVMAAQPGLVVFGEGGETEVGGPASFFRRIFDSLGINAATQAAARNAAGGTTQPIMIRLELGGRALKDFVVDTANAGLANGEIRTNRRGVVERAF